MPVAKSYQSLPILCEPYTKNGRQYCKVKTKTGIEKEVRWYNAREYTRLYPDAPKTANIKPQKDVLGFEKGYITLVHGAEADLERSNARYCVHWGWYIVSTEEVPPKFVAVPLKWEKIGNANGSLKDSNIIKTEVKKAWNGLN